MPLREKYDIMINMEKQKQKSIKALDLINLIVFIVTLSVFAFCIIYAVVSMILDKESPIVGYGKYGFYELIQRVGIFLLILVPFILRKLRVVLPAPFTIAFNIFMLITVFGGTFMGLYINTHWWDKFNHTLSGVLLGLAGMFFLNSLTKSSEKVGSFGIVLYAFAFAVMCGAVWEIYEFTCDGLFGSNMQKFRNDHTLEEYIGRAALMDTMIDVVVDAVGAVIAGIFCAVMTARNRNFLRIFEIKILPKKTVCDTAAADSVQLDAQLEAAATGITEDMLSGDCGEDGVAEDLKE